MGAIGRDDNPPHGYQIVVVRTELGSATDWSWSVADDWERRCALRLSTDDLRARYLVAHGVLRRILATTLDRDPGEIAFDRDRCGTCGENHGKPRVRGVAGVEFSLSRTRDHLAVATGPTPIGVDIDTDLSARQASQLLPSLHPEERAVVSAAPESGRVATELWVRKEAALKCLGVGLAVDPATFSVVGAPPVAVGGTRLRTAPVPSWESTRTAVAIHDLPAQFTYRLESWGRVDERSDPIAVHASGRRGFGDDTGSGGALSDRWRSDGDR